MVLNLKHQTNAQFLERFRKAYRDAEGEQKARMDALILDAIDAGEVTDAQVRQAFGKTVAEYNQMKVRMTTLRGQHDAVRAARGE